MTFYGDMGEGSQLSYFGRVAPYNMLHTIHFTFR
jgi:hypothetical protein